MKLSIVTSMYNSAAHLEEFHRRISAVAQKITGDYEIVMVNDGSPDASLGVALQLQKQDARIKIVDLSRNFGEHKARMTGLMQSSGDYVYLVQCDMEVAPEYLLEFWNDLQAAEGIDMIYGLQNVRRGSGLERLSGIAFYKVFNLLSDVKIGTNDAGCRLMTRRFVNALLEHKERTIFFAGLCVITGFGQKAHMVDKVRLRKSSYSLARKISMVVNALTSFSVLPLLIVFYLGLAILGLSFLYTLRVLFTKIFYGIAIGGWTSLIVSLWLLGGIMISSIGLVGMYLSRVFIEAKQRPYTIIKDIYTANQ